MPYKILCASSIEKIGTFGKNQKGYAGYASSRGTGALFIFYGSLKSMIELIYSKLDEITAACKQHQVEALSLFGSAARDAMHTGSDIDLLVAFSGDIDVLDYADNYFSLLEQLQRILNKKVDLVSNRSLKNTILKEEIYRTKVDLYAA